MSKTVLLCNPIGVDDTQLMNTLLRGTILNPTDTLINIAYTNQPGAANIADGVAKLDAKINDVRGEKLVFAHDLGAQVATKWIRDHNADSNVPAADLSFLMIGNAERKYGGMIHGLDGFSAIADTAGLPGAKVRWQVTDFARQYDGWADFPTAPKIRAILEGMSAIGAGETVYTETMRAIASAVTDNADWTAMANVIAGMASVHTVYFDVAVDDPNNISYVDPAQPNVRYVWAPTYPVPMLGTLATFPQEDRRFRTLIETCYQRPAAIPMPDYPHTSWLSMRVPWQKPAVTGWFAEVNAVAVLSLTPAMSLSAYTGDAVTTMSLTMSMSSAALGRAGSFARTVAMSLTAAMTADGSGGSVANASMSLAAGMAVVASERYVRAVEMTLTPEISASAVESYARTVALGLTAALAVEGGGVSVAGVDMALTAGMSADAAASSVSEVGMSLTAVLGSRLPDSIAATVELRLTPDMDVAGADGSTVSDAIYYLDNVSSAVVDLVQYDLGSGAASTVRASIASTQAMALCSDGSGGFYFVDGGGVRQYKPGTDDLTTIATGAWGAYGITVGPGGVIYFIDTSTLDLISCDPTSGVTETICVSGGYVCGADDSYVYWCDIRATPVIYRLDPAVGIPEAIPGAPAATAYGVTAQDGKLWFYDGSAQEFVAFDLGDSTQQTWPTTDTAYAVFPGQSHGYFIDFNTFNLKDLDTETGDITTLVSGLQTIGLVVV